MTLQNVLDEIDKIQKEKRAMRFIWNESADEGLLQCVEYFTRTGFNRLENGDVGTWKLKVGFWNAVASALAYHLMVDNGPRPNACEKRWRIVLDKYTDPNDPFPRVHFDPAIDLSKYDDAWQTASTVVIDYQQEQIERAIATLQSVQERAGELAADAFMLIEMLEIPSMTRRYRKVEQ